VALLFTFSTLGYCISCRRGFRHGFDGERGRYTSWGLLPIMVSLRMLIGVLPKMLWHPCDSWDSNRVLIIKCSCINGLLFQTPCEGQGCISQVLHLHSWITFALEGIHSKTLHPGHGHKHITQSPQNTFISTLHFSFRVEQLYTP
jgi:hypothetical protein